MAGREGNNKRSSSKPFTYSVASDETSCASCLNLNNNDNRNSYSSTDGDCACVQPGTSDSTGGVITYKLAEAYNVSAGNAMQTWKECVQCPSGQAVIDADLTTMGRVYTADKYTCATCPDPNMFFTNTSPKRCECGGGMISKGKESVGELYCVSSTSAITTSYEVEYFNVQTNVKNAATGSYSVDNSDVLEHYLDWGYYNCYADNFLLTSMTPTVQRWVLG